MMPDWLDFERLQAVLGGLSVLAVLLSLLFLTLARSAALKVVSVMVFGALALGAAWQLQTINDARRTDCSKVELFGARIVVPACPGQQT